MVNSSSDHNTDQKSIENDSFALWADLQKVVGASIETIQTLSIDPLDPSNLRWAIISRDIAKHTRAVESFLARDDRTQKLTRTLANDKMPMDFLVVPLFIG